MKIQCACGAKFEFEVTPEMARQPVQFVCPACGLDASEYVNGLVRQELERGAPVQAATLPGPAAAPSPARPAIRVRTPEARSPEAEAVPEPASPPCLKHPGQLAVERCVVCSKPICPKCMELFGHVCSPLCRARAESHGITVPVFAGQRSVALRRHWRVVGQAALAIGLVAMAVLGFWIWYAWIGSVPKAVFSVRFSEAAYSGQSAASGKDQLVFLHGGTLARYDIKGNKQIWSRQLIDNQQMEAQVAEEIKDIQAAIDKALAEDPDNAPKMPPADKLKQMAETEAAAALQLRLNGSNIWVVSANKLVRYDWDTGAPAKEIPLPEGSGGLIARGDTMLLVQQDGTNLPSVMRVNLATCESANETLGGLPPSAPAGEATPKPVVKSKGKAGAGLPIGMPGKDAGKAMDPAKVAQRAQQMSMPGKIALPIVLANARNQERILEEMRDQPRRPEQPAAEPDESLSLVPTKDGFVQFSVKLLERRITQRSAMKAPPAKSVLDGNLTANKTSELANEVLNEMQRSRGGDTVQEDESRYDVKLRPPQGEGWSGEVAGPPAFFPLATVNVLAANKKVLVFDKSYKKLWEATMDYNIGAGPGAWDSENALYGQGPCAEHKGALYVFDQSGLTAFDAASGATRWHLPSVGITGVFFDDRDMIYVNSTTASFDSLKYSRQIDVTDTRGAISFKIDAKTGRILWSEKLGGMITYVSGKFIYTMQSYAGESDDEALTQTGLETPAYMKIRRVNPKNGQLLWEHSQQRAPLNVQFDHNTIRLVFKKEVQVLRFVAF